ncbi:helix-turn-helix domain-containing protein [Nocardia veterana]|uniref:Helix-turn-helix transcriptional regulator n=1 Tax=Nocardia veterana TaxID=132249 RepID=A0A7X6LUG1_9NOCA|nr:helix-turn-helix transcriptional regulator [Nocardia veterana]NKY84269.1 helix-turn-helix transcriptional regulator [Nocardia veterana]
MTTQKDFDAVLAAKRATPEYRAAYRAAQLAHTLGVQIRAAREARGWSQTELAARAGLRQHAVSRLEAGDVVPTLTTLERIAEALEAELSVSLAA